MPLVKNLPANVGEVRDVGWIPGLTILWRRKWQSTPVFLPGESHGQKSLVSPSPLGRKELDTTEQLNWTELNWLIYSIKSLFPILPIEITSIVSTSPSRFWLLWKYNLSLILKLNTFKHYAIYHFIDFNWESVKEETRNCFKSSQPTGARPWSLVRK